MTVVGIAILRNWRCKSSWCKKTKTLEKTESNFRRHTHNDITFIPKISWNRPTNPRGSKASFAVNIETVGDWLVILLRSRMMMKRKGKLIKHKLYQRLGGLKFEGNVKSLLNVINHFSVGVISIWRVKEHLKCFHTK